MSDELKAQGNAAFAAKDFTKAVDLFTQAIAVDPQNAVLYSNRSGAYASQKNFEKALEDGNKAVELKPEWSKAYNRRGAALHGLGQLPEASEAYDEALKRDPSNAQAKAGKKSVEDAIAGSGPQAAFMKMFNDPQNIMKLQQNPRTREYLNDPTFTTSLMEAMKNPLAVFSSPNADKRVVEAFSVIMGLPTDAVPESNDSPQSNAGQSSSQSSESKPEPKKPEPAASSSTSSTSTSKDPEQVKAEEEKQLGNTAYRQRSFDEAIKHYDNAWEIYKDVTFLNNRAAAEFEKGDYETAIKTCELAVEQGQEHHADYKTVAKSLSRIGTCYAKLNDLKQAIYYFEKSLTEHRSADVLTKLRAAQRDQRIAEEKAYIDPAKSAEERERGNTLFKEGDFPASVKAYTEAIKRDPSDPRGYGNRAASYLKLMDYPDAVKDCDKAIELDPKFVKAYTRKATAQSVMKQYRKAMDTLDAARSVDDGKHAREIEELYQKAVNQRFASLPGETEDQRTERLVQDPEINEIRSDPVMNTILQQASNDPAALRVHMQNPEVNRKIQLLIAAGVIRTR